jgi:hypothetical protein
MIAYLMWPLIQLAIMALDGIIATAVIIILIMENWLNYDDRKEYVPKCVRSHDLRYLRIQELLTSWVHSYFNWIDVFIMSMKTKKKLPIKRPTRGTRHYYVRAYSRSKAQQSKKCGSYIAVKNGHCRDNSSKAYSNFWK